MVVVPVGSPLYYLPESGWIGDVMGVVGAEGVPFAAPAGADVLVRYDCMWPRASVPAVRSSMPLTSTCSPHNLFQTSIQNYI